MLTFYTPSPTFLFIHRLIRFGEQRFKLARVLRFTMAKPDA
jgi:hypothetical protein